MNKTVIIGLTGPTGAGKTTVAAELQRLGCDIIDCDAVAKEAVDNSRECIEQLCSKFGNDIIDENGRLKRRELAHRAFSSEQNSNALNQIVHPVALKRVIDQITCLRNSRITAIIVDAPLLFESGWDSLCDVTIAVTAPREIRLERIMKRDAINKETANERINAQHGDDYYTEKTDYWIDGSKNLEQVAAETKRILNSIAGGANEKA